MTHQEIADAFESIYARSREVSKIEREWIGVERNRLQAACAEVGHIWGRGQWLSPVDRCCQVCNAYQPTETPARSGG